MTINKPTRIIINIGVIGSLIAPQFLIAQTMSPSPRPSQSMSPQQGKTFCARLPQTFGKIEQQLKSKVEKLGSKRVDRNSSIQKRRSNQDTQLTSIRTEWDKNRQEHYAKLESLASTDAQKTAVLNFKNAMEAAVAQRRIAVDNAKKTFRDNVTQTLKDRQGAIDTIHSSFKTALGTAYSKAQTDCSSGVDPKVVRSELRASIKAAREKLTRELSGVEKNKVSSEALIKQRQEAFRKALESFRQSAEKARKDLKAVLGVKPSLSPRPSRLPRPSLSPSPSSSPVVSPSPSA